MEQNQIDAIGRHIAMHAIRVPQPTPMTSTPEQRVADAAQAMCEASGKTWRVGTYEVHSGPRFEIENHALDPSNNHWRGKAKAALASTEEIVRLREALTAITEIGGEINPSNYNHEDVHALNGSYIEMFQIARAALNQEKPPCQVMKMFKKSLPKRTERLRWRITRSVSTRSFMLQRALLTVIRKLLAMTNWR
jgi:hypothetical protein